MAKILVPGGAGYIGSHVVQQLLAAGHDVVVYDNLCTGFADAVPQGAELIVADVGDTTLLRELLADGKFDAVIHFAASLLVPESVAAPLKYYINNTVKTTGLIQACVDAGVHRIIFSSTAAVYGTPTSGQASEDSATVPINPYGSSKLMSEWVLRDTAAATDLEYVALRYFNVAGAAVDGSNGQRTLGATHLVTVACQAALGVRPSMGIFGADFPTHDGTGVRDYIHIEDLASAHLRALDYLLQGGTSQVLNCGYGHGSSVREVIAMVKQVSGVDFDVLEQPRRAGDPPALYSRADRIRQVLDWHPKYDDLELICRTALAWERTKQRS